MPTCCPSVGTNSNRPKRNVISFPFVNSALDPRIQQQRGVELGLNPAVSRLGSGMTLAVILSVCLAYSAPPRALGHWRLLASHTYQTQTSQNQASPDQAPQDQTSRSQASQSQAAGARQSVSAGTGAQTQPPTAPAAQTPSTRTAGQQKPATRKRVGHKKKAVAVASTDCPPVKSAKEAVPAGTVSTDGSANATPSKQSQSDPAPSGPPNQTPSNQAPSKNAGSKANVASGDASPGNCPPAKTIIPEGGTSEPAIQLIGGKGAEQTSQQRSRTDQLLESTEDNLKKAAMRQLNASQQEMVSQIQQFIEQSKAAVAAGDVERGRNLARKAHLLSDELVKP